MKIGVGYVQRDFCDGQSLASRGRWPPGALVYPSTSAWTAVRDCFWRFTSHHGTERLLVELAMGKVQSSPFPPAEVAQLKQQVIDTAARSGLSDRTQNWGSHRRSYRLSIPGSSS